MFYAGKMHHQVAPWTPLPQRETHTTTTGRIGTVLFFPHFSLKILRMESPGWGKATRYGKYEIPEKELEKTEDEKEQFWEGDEETGEGIER